ncbi:uncharacterized protein LOC143919440 [Arctopsyche grandis]|uniref:uncharacterized protein LOC143919440 n=1 Tax=Arctopsyche grandis TaxID=121162 RepID=UPI00406D781D
MGDWTNDCILKLLELYRDEPILWDPNHKYHKDRRRCHNAWIRLSDALQVPVTELKKKKDSIMATYRSHLRKKKSLTDEDYKPVWFAYEAMDAFLGQIVNTQHTIESAKNHSEVNHEIIPVNNEVIVSWTPPGQTAETRQKFQPVENSSELQEATKEMKEAFGILKNVLNKRSNEDDECDLFTKLLAKKLKKLPNHERELFMYEIDGLFIKRSNQVNQINLTLPNS